MMSRGTEYHAAIYVFSFKIGKMMSVAFHNLIKPLVLIGLCYELLAAGSIEGKNS